MSTSLVMMYGAIAGAVVFGIALAVTGSIIFALLLSAAIGWIIGYALIRAH